MSSRGISSRLHLHKNNWLAGTHHKFQPFWSSCELRLLHIKDADKSIRLGILMYGGVSPGLAMWHVLVWASQGQQRERERGGGGRGKSWWRSCVQRCGSAAADCIWMSVIRSVLYLLECTNISMARFVKLPVYISLRNGTLFVIVQWYRGLHLTKSVNFTVRNVRCLL